MELLSPAGRWEAMAAAVQNGADAVYLGCGALNARRGAKNFTAEELPEDTGLQRAAKKRLAAGGRIGMARGLLRERER